MPQKVVAPLEPTASPGPRTGNKTDRHKTVQGPFIFINKIDLPFGQLRCVEEREVTVSVIVSEAIAPRRWIGETLAELRLLSPFLLVVALYILAVTAIGYITGLDSHVELTLYTQATGLSMTVGVPLALVIYYLYLMIVARERHPIARMGRDFKAYIIAPPALIGLTVPIIVISYFASAFSSFKGMIGTLNPFYLDAALAKADQFIHFGVQPWRITHFFFHDFASAMTINFAYNLWFFIVWGYAFCQIFGLAGRLHRAQYLLSFVLCWVVVGSVLAVILSSAGPCYFGRITGLPDPFAPLMKQLYAMDAPHLASGSYWHLWSLSVQETLWNEQFQSTTSIGSGISAMPSMHVSMAYLLAFSAIKLGKWFGRVMLAYAIVISFGSVYLGWHYAVDGYVSIAVTYLIWRFSGHIVDRLNSEPSKFFSRASIEPAV